MSTPTTDREGRDLRIEFRTRNNALWHLIFDQSPSVSEFSRVHGLPEVDVGRLLNLTMDPRYPATNRFGTELARGGELRKVAQQLCDLSGYGASDLFPPALYSGVIPKRGVAEVPSARFVELTAARRLALPPTQEDDALRREQRDALEAVLHTLTPREEKVVRLHFGLGVDLSTLDEIGTQLDVTRERVRQIEAKAMRKLRQTPRLKTLWPFAAHWLQRRPVEEPAAVEAVEPVPEATAAPVVITPAIASWREAIRAAARKGLARLGPRPANASEAHTVITLPRTLLEDAAVDVAYPILVTRWHVPIDGGRAVAIAHFWTWSVTDGFPSPAGSTPGEFT